MEDRLIEIGIVGGKNSGKTTLVETLLPLFVHAGIKVATIKHTSHRHQFDHPGKDSSRHRAAGACATLAKSDSDLALFMPPTGENFGNARAMLAAVCDLCLVEGDKTANRPKVLLTRLGENWSQNVYDNVIVTFGPGKGRAGLPHFERGSEEKLAIYLMEHFHLLKGEVSSAV